MRSEHEKQKENLKYNYFYDPEIYPHGTVDGYISHLENTIIQQEKVIDNLMHEVANLIKH